MYSGFMSSAHQAQIKSSQIESNPPESSRTRRTSILKLTLLGPIVLSACTSAQPEYVRSVYPSYANCYAEYSVIPGLETPCVQSGGSWYGPYYYGTGNVHYLGYSPLGDVLLAGVIYNNVTRTRSSYREPRAVSAVRSAKVVQPGSFGGSTSRSGGTSSSTTRSSTTPRVSLDKGNSPGGTVRSTPSTVSRGGFGGSTRSSGG
jgi:hypothetical protein